MRNIPYFCTTKEIINMTTVLIDDNSQESNILLEYVKRYPDLAQVMDKGDNTPLPMSEEELLSLEEFKAYMEELALERLGLKLTL